MREKKHHIALKKIARNILMSMGYLQNEIFYEYKVDVGKQSWWKIDIVGISKVKKTFIECGYVGRKSKLNQVTKWCDMFIYLPYLNRCFGRYGRQIQEITSKSLS